MTSLRLLIEDGKFTDAHGRQVVLRGINVAGDAKYPSVPDQPSHVPDAFFDGDDVKFSGKPFPKEDAHTHFARLKRYGYNYIRYVFTWEAIEAAGPGKYDEDWIKHTIEVLRIAREYGFHVVMDPHQDVWSRFSGGSGAPMWTLYACGLNPQSFAATEAAIVHNTYPDPAKFPKMIWSTNYYRLAAATIFTLFFGGRDFAPKCIIDGVNIQDYLQEHFLNAVAHLAKRIHEAGDLEDIVVVGWETMNEPNRGLIGNADLSVIPKEQALKKGTSPTIWQAILIGSGRACEVETWDMGGLGPYKVGRALVDPHGEIAWLPADYDESRYGYKRDAGWKLGECLWAQHGIWDPENDQLLKKDYFSKNPKTGQVLDYPAFTNSYFMDFVRKYRERIRAIHKDAILLLQPAVLEIPPSLKGTPDDDPRMGYAPHFYDGITLMTKKWNRTWNVDVLGILRGRYLHPALAIKIGETAIRNCFRDQLAAMRQEGLDYMGNHPCVLTEFGIPYDMDEKHAYKTGDYVSQSAAMDANHFAVEGAMMEGYGLWTYVTKNDHERGDQWNGEDLSIYSVDDNDLPKSPVPRYTDRFLDPNTSRPSLSRTTTSSTRRNADDDTQVTPGNLKRTITNASISSEAVRANPELTHAPGYRAAEAFVRPAPVAVAGRILNYGFDLKKCEFVLKLQAPRPAAEEYPTVLFLPEYHFPKETTIVESSSGKWEISSSDDEGVLIQRLKWWHIAGEQSITIKGVIRKHQLADGSTHEDASGIYDQCNTGAANNCSVM